jgi:hypothetical protein
MNASASARTPNEKTKGIIEPLGMRDLHSVASAFSMLST